MVAMNKWLQNGGTHLLFLGDWHGRLEMLCRILDVEYVEV